MAARAYDVVIFGATGFTGRLAAEHLARRIAGSADLSSKRFALAGRSEEKLLALRSRLAKEISPECSDLAILVGDGGSDAFLEEMLTQTKVVMTYVGPYLKYSLPLARACVKHRTDYCDITGEAPYQQRIIEELHEAAKENGTTLITSCGYDSIPFDVGTHGLVKHLRERAREELGEEAARGATISVQALDGAARGGVSGGTIASAESFVGIAKPLGPQCLDPGFQEGASSAPAFPYAAGQMHHRDSSFLGPSIMEAVNQKVV